MAFLTLRVQYQEEPLLVDPNAVLAVRGLPYDSYRGHELSEVFVHGASFVVIGSAVEVYQKVEYMRGQP